MAKKLTEDAVRDAARDILGLADSDVARRCWTTDYV